MKFEEKYFTKFNFTPEQIRKNFKNAQKDLNIAKKVDILEVQFNYAYSSIIKIGLTLLSFYGAKIKSAPGHHIRIIEKLSDILKDDSIADLGNLMRSKRNLDLYAGGLKLPQRSVRSI